MIDSNWNCEPASNRIPSFFSFVVFRTERFGGLLFNPYLGPEMELDPIEAYLALLCNGSNSCRQIEASARSRFGLTANKSREYISSFMEKCEQMCALTMHEGSEPTRPIIPDTPLFPPNGPYLSAPKGVVWDITYACNLNCAHCLTSSGYAQPGELKTQQAIELINRLVEAKVLRISLSGGEPFMRRDLIDLLKYCATKTLSIDIATNGTWLPKEVVRELRDLPIFRVQVSIDGIEEQHDLFRGKHGAFAKSCQTIRQLVEQGISVSISTTVTAENIAELEQIIDLACDLGCIGFKAIPFLPAGRGQQNANRLRLNAYEHKLFAELLVRRRNELEGVLHISSETCFAFLLEPPPATAYVDGPMGCSAGYDTLSIGADGTVYPCPFLRSHPLGNILDRPLRELWIAAPTLNTLRSLHKEDMRDPCKSCLYAPLVCRGGCRAAAYMEHGDLLECDPTCFAALANSESNDDFALALHTPRNGVLLR